MTEQEKFIREANRQAAKDAATANREKMTAEEIALYLLSTATFTEAEAWEIADELKNGKN